MILKKKERGRKYIPCRVRYVLNQMRVRLIPLSFYIIFSEESELEVEKWGKVYGEMKKRGPQVLKN